MIANHTHRLTVGAEHLDELLVTTTEEEKDRRSHDRGIQKEGTREGERGLKQRRNGRKTGRKKKEKCR